MGLFALLLVGATLCCIAVADDSNAEWVDITSDDSFVGIKDTMSFTISGDAKYYYKAEIRTNDGSVSGTGSVSSSSGYLSTTKEGGGYYRNVTVTAPSDAGDYRVAVKFYAADDSSYTTVLFEKSVPLKVVEPVTLKFKLYNNSASSIQLTVYFVINGEKVTDSDGTQTITIDADNSKEVTYDYVVRDVSDTTYMLCCDDTVLSGSIDGLNVEKKFYTSQANYQTFTIVLVLLLVLVFILFIYILRKPVVNKGKPKGRR